MNEQVDQHIQEAINILELIGMNDTPYEIETDIIRARVELWEVQKILDAAAN